MEAIRKQASKLREQVAKQQQAVLSRLGKEAAIFDDEELQSYQQLQDLYNSTRVTKHFQRDILHGVEGFISISKKQMQISKKLAEDCCKNGTENGSAGFPLARAAQDFGTSHNSIEDERDTMLDILASQVAEPLRASIKGAPLEDARHLAHRCERLRHEVEAQAVKVLRRQAKVRDPTAESLSKFKSLEVKLSELRSSMVTLQREAIAALLSVEEQQQQITFQKLLNMVDAERLYHQHVVAILGELHAEMVMQESAQSAAEKDLYVPPKDATQCEHDRHANKNSDCDFFIGKVIHQFDAQADGELSLAVDDYVVVRQVAPNGWSEGECNGKRGWFPSAYIKRHENNSEN